MNPSLQQLAETLLWSSSDIDAPDDDTSLDEYSVHDIDTESLSKLHQNFQAFVDKAEAEITKVKGSDWVFIDDFYTGSASGGFYLEHDYILTVNGHGCGFWEEFDWEPEVGRILTELAHQEKEIHCFTNHVDHGRNGKVYFEFG